MQRRGVRTVILLASGIAIGLWAQAVYSYPQDSSDDTGAKTTSDAASSGTNVKLEKVSQKLDEVLEKEDQILQKFDAVMEELRIIKVRASLHH